MATEKKYTTEQLIKIKNRMAELEAETQRAEGRLSELTAQLERDFQVRTVEEADKLLTSMDIEIEQKTVRLNAGLKQLEQDFNWEAGK